MRDIPSAVITHLASGGALLTHVLIWLTARNRSTNAEATLGLWTGDDAEEITVGGAERTYYGAGAVLDLDPMISSSRLQVHRWAFRVSPLSDAVVTAVRQYNARLAAVEVHEWFWDPVAHAPLADPVRAFRGTIMDVQMPVAALDSEAVATITCVSDAWRLTKGLTLKKSDAALQARAPGDRFRQYNTITAAPVVWGDKLETQPGGSAGAGGGASGPEPPPGYGGRS
jgi:hypothetical protein